jgi:AraC-like DNA-binding protein
MLTAAESRGFETRDLLIAVGLDPETVEDPDARLSGATVIALWDALRERCGDPALQLGAPTALPFGAYRVIDYLVAAAPTVGEGVALFSRFFRLIASAVHMDIETDGDERRLCVALADGAAVPGEYVDYVFAALVGRIRMRPRPGLRLRRVELRHPAPFDPAPWTDCFLAPVTFEAVADRLCFDRDEWEAPIEHADAALAAILEAHAATVAARAGEPDGAFVESVRRVLTTALTEAPNAETVARALHVSLRTLQRKLAAAGTTFREVSDGTRQRLAESYLADPRVSITEIAFLLGFSDQASFTRAYRRWSGEPPGVWRKRALGRLPAG